jgi:signal transduction histidine kinase
MSRLALLEGDASGGYGLVLADTEVFRDLEALLGALRKQPGTFRWIALAPDLRDREGAALQLQEVDPRAGVLLLPTGSDSDPHELAAALAATDDDRSRRTELLASVAALTAEIAHDVGTPLTSILGYGELLAKSLEDDKNRKRAMTIVEQVHRVTELIDTLVRLSRSASSAPARLELPRVVDKAVDFYREKFKRRGIEIDRRYEPCPAVDGDPDGLQLAIMNLLLETFDGMTEGGTLGVAIGEHDAGVAVRIRSAGSRPRPSTNATARRVTRTIVEEHGGRLELVPAPDGGEEFVIALPAATPRSVGAR